MPSSVVTHHETKAHIANTTAARWFGHAMNRNEHARREKKYLVAVKSTQMHSPTFLFFTHIYFPAASGRAVVTGVAPSPPRFLPSIFIAHRVQQFHCSSIFRRVLLTHALAFSVSQFVRKKKSPRIYTSMHSGGFELTKLTYTRLEYNLIRHRKTRGEKKSTW